MAVEATYINLLPSSHLLTNRETMKSNNHPYYYHHHQQQQMLNCDLYNNNNSLMDSVLPLPHTTTTTTTMHHESLLHFYQSNVCDPNKADSGLTYNIPLQRKRSRDFTSELLVSQLQPHQKNKLSSSPHQSPSFIDQALLQFQNQQSEIDRILVHHTKKVRMVLEEHKVRQTRMLASVIQETVAKKLKEKDEEIERMGKLNWALQERVKALSAENQVWRELAQTNETTANYLRSNLEQVMMMSHSQHVVKEVVEEDAVSSCGSNGGYAAENGEETAGNGGGRMCKKCGVREAIVLLLPCRHLCLCTVCGSTMRNCPVCDSGMDASVHVNLS